MLPLLLIRLRIVLKPTTGLLVRRSFDGSLNIAVDLDELPSKAVVQWDVADLKWAHLTGVEILDLGVASPPCPPWSLASTAPGFLR